jgi:hypothetical protein
VCQTLQLISSVDPVFSSPVLLAQRPISWNASAAQRFERTKTKRLREYSRSPGETSSSGGRYPPGSLPGVGPSPPTVHADTSSRTNATIVASRPRMPHCVMRSANRVTPLVTVAYRSAVYQRASRCVKLPFGASVCSAASRSISLLYVTSVGRKMSNKCSIFLPFPAPLKPASSLHYS